MFNRLRTKWHVNGRQFALIMLTFALGGSLCGRLGRLVATMMLERSSMFFWPLAIILMSLLWPIAVLAISIPLGQFKFFRNYLRRIATRMGLMKES